MPYFSPKDVEAKKSCPKTFICPLLFINENKAFLIGQNKSHDYAYKYHSTQLLNLIYKKQNQTLRI